VPVVLYLLAVQVLLLGIAADMAMVVVGLAMFLEGLMLAIMPVGELCGLGLPRRMKLPGILLVAAPPGASGHDRGTRRRDLTPIVRCSRESPGSEVPT